MNQELYVATLSTRHFEFAAYGESESQAHAALLRGVILHLRQCEMMRGIKELMAAAVIRPVFLGECYRDNQLMEPK